LSIEEVVNIVVAERVGAGAEGVKAADALSLRLRSIQIRLVVRDCVSSDFSTAVKCTRSALNCELTASS
jgi:hypothetical protein